MLHRNPPRVEGRRDAGRGDREDRQPAPGTRLRGRGRVGRRRATPTRPTRRSPTPGSRVGSAEEVWAADVVVKVNAPTAEEIGRLRAGATVISMMAPARSPELVEQLAAQGVTALAMDAVPRISRAQSMDVLSSMANVAGYRAVVEAAHEFGRMFTGQVTAAGKIAAGPGLRGGCGCRRAGGDRRGVARWARSCARSTSGPRWPSRSSRWADSSSRSTSTPR